MGLFSQDTAADAMKCIEKVNEELRAISALMHHNYNMIDGRNRDKIIPHYNNIIKNVRKYEKIINNLSMYDKLELQCTKIYLWNGEYNDVTAWEFKLPLVLHQLERDINY
jgi:hypothetical protein